MSVLIKGMEMPKNCWLCPLSVLYDKPREVLFCRISKEEVLRYKIDSNCPLTEIQSHGRLIDADALVKSIKDQIELIKQFHNDDMDMIAQMIEVGYVQEIANAPTILKAEVGE